MRSSDSLLRYSSLSLSPEERLDSLRELAGSRNFQVFLSLVAERLLDPADSRLRASKEVLDMGRAQGSVESLEAVLTRGVLDDPSALPHAQQPRQRRELGGKIGRQLDHDGMRLSAGRGTG